MKPENSTVILIADDHPDNLKVILNTLQRSRADTKFLQATTGKMAVRIAAMRLPDLIIMDWEMPDLSGYEALIQIKNNPDTRDIPVIMATGRASSEDLKKALAAGASDYIRKPVEKMELSARVNTCLSINSLLKEVKEKNNVLEDLNREKDGVVNVVAHDLRTPLNNIYGLANLIEMDGNLNVEQKGYLLQMKDVVQRGNALIQDLLDVNSAKSGNSSVKLVNISIGKFLDAWQSGFSTDLIKKEQKLNISYDIANETLCTDKGLLIRVLDNILTNAMKFSEKGKTIEVKVSELDQTILFEIRDQGPGISEEDQRKMFKPFTRLSARPTAGEHTNGLGLSIIKTLTEKIGGAIRVESVLGEGTTFFVSVPQQTMPEQSE